MSAGFDIYALHGFGGQPGDFASVGLSELAGVRSIVAPDLCAELSAADLPDLADRLNRRRASDGRRPAVLLGYSLGGRVALHMVTRAPRLWSAAVLVSAHPGLARDADRGARREADQAWARRFASAEPWPDLLAAWNEQAVFAGRPYPTMLQRAESPALRADLARSLGQWSLAGQADLRSAIARIELPLLWITGQLDPRYGGLAREIVDLHPASRAVQAPASGHRVPWEAPGEFRALLGQFLTTLTTQPRGEINV